MYSRHKPNIQWKPEADYPEFNQIKADQSFNWSAFSIPIWTRFNDKMEFLKDYGIIGIKVETIYRSSRKFIQNVNPILFHKLLETNYSHCEMNPECVPKNKKKRREFRMMFKHNAIVYLKPFDEYASNKEEESRRIKSDLTTMKEHYKISISDEYESIIEKKHT